MKKFGKSLIIGGFNPFHKGHYQLLKISQDYSNFTDIYIGNKKRKNRLPRDIRTKSVETIIKHNNWKNHINVIQKGKYTDLNPAEYSLFIAGSDFLNFLSMNISSRGKKIKNCYKDFYLSFPNTLIINRDEMPLKQEARNKLARHTNILNLEGTVDVSGTQIREAYKNGEDISKMVADNIWEIIKDYIHIFND